MRKNFQAATSTGLLWIVGGKWFPRAVVYLKMADGKIAWQADLLGQSQQEMLRRTRAAAPEAYAAAVLENKVTGEGFPEGFTIEPNVPENLKADMPEEAKFSGSLNGILNEDGTITWGLFKSKP